MKKASIITLTLVYLFLSFSACSDNDTSSETTYNVIFDSQGGSIISTQSITMEDTVSEPVDPIKTGNRFDGWFTDIGCTTVWDFINDTVNEEITLYAKWVIQHNVNFDSQEGSAIASQNIDTGLVASEPADPAKGGFTFDGWYADVGLTTAWDFINDTVNGDITIYAKWTYVEYSIGDTGPGNGLIFYDNSNYLTDGWRYLESTTSDQSIDIEWGGYEVSVIGTVREEVGTGFENTQDIIDTLGIGFDYAAKICYELDSGGYDDWFLPSVDELELMYDNLEVASIGDFANDMYWSSTEYIIQSSGCYNFVSGTAGGNTKIQNYRVRAIRMF